VTCNKPRRSDVRPSERGLVAAEPDAIGDRSSELDAAFVAQRDWLVRHLALIVGDAEEARDLAQETFVRASSTGRSRIRPSPLDG
jgi:DNA-directed RNA polymerase specialized sigma24 family protein